MNYRCTASLSTTLFLLTQVLAPVVSRAAGKIDFLDYFLQKDDLGDRWTIGGKDVREDRDPDGTDAPTYILNKWSSPNTYEVYKVTTDDVQIRYEVVRHADRGVGNWARRFEEIDATNPAPGAIWCKRMIDVGGEGYLSRYREDKFHWDPATKAYVLEPDHSGDNFQTYLTTQWATVDWGKNNPDGLKLNPVLRLTSEWQREGKIFENYDYAKGKGPVNWRWLERVTTLPTVENDRTGKLFACENGQVWVDSIGDPTTKPVVFKYDPATKSKVGQPLEVIQFISYWRKDLGPQWYVVYRDSAREEVLEMKQERVEHDFTLPEWKDKPGATITDLPYVHTHRAR